MVTHFPASALPPSVFSLWLLLQICASESQCDIVPLALRGGKYFLDVLWGPLVSLSVCTIISNFNSKEPFKNSEMKLFCILMTLCHLKAPFQSSLKYDCVSTIQRDTPGCRPCCIHCTCFAEVKSLYLLIIRKKIPQN